MEPTGRNRRLSTMNDRERLAVCADYVKENVSAQDVAVVMGWEVRRGRCRCPIHGGHDFNCVLYPGNRGFACHVCKAGGDVIRLVRESEQGMSFLDALKWFNVTFNLGMKIDSPVDEKRLKQAKNRIKRKEEERAFRERVDRAQFDMYLAVDRALERLEKQRDVNRPKRYGEGWNREFCDAIRVIPDVQKYREYFLMTCTETKR